MMAGLDEPDAGAILKPSALTVGYLPQDGLTHAGRTVFDEAASAFAELLGDEEPRCTRSKSGSAMRRFRKPSTTRCCPATATCRIGSGCTTATASS